ncbi:carbohydrate ABC transporter permease [Paenibacillus nasutitermitis]|uniref:Spermidine/putrescine ABC transporter permease n=1 Tax=Paenibacillus nasutitermitis TaxID=1652958 RepID=A0A916ZGB0_9BACL|nr:sugar ABC transporter permease [Paenibacillus nasutitermitis]GGD96019.1 spermidine/putrescine ABC transporter permease [Paenibacillus nasutitermitis]
MRKKNFGLARMEQRWGVLFALPAIAGFLIFSLGPIIASMVISLTDWQIGQSLSFIGFENYNQIFAHDELFAKSASVTTYYALGSVPVVLVLAFIVALLLNQKVKGLPVFRTIYYLPVVVPSVASSMLWLWLFNPDFGLLNMILKSVGLPGSDWIYAESSVIPSLIIMSTWGIGNAMIIFLAGLQNTPAHLYEAVEVDGGSAFRKLIHVTIPLMTPTIFFNLIMSLISSFQIFNQAYIMTEGGPNNSSLFYVYYLYRKAFTETKVGYASALAWILFIVVMVLTFIVFKTSRKWVYYEGEQR